MASEARVAKSFVEILHHCRNGIRTCDMCDHGSGMHEPWCPLKVVGDFVEQSCTAPPEAPEPEPIDFRLELLKHPDGTMEWVEDEPARVAEGLEDEALEAARYVVATAQWISDEVDEDPEMVEKVERGARIIHALLERAPREPDLFASEVRASGPESGEPVDDAIHALAEGVAQATIERVWDEIQAGNIMDRIYGERHALADEMADLTMHCAREDPDSEVHAVRRHPDRGGRSPMIIDHTKAPPCECEHYQPWVTSNVLHPNPKCPYAPQRDDTSSQPEQAKLTGEDE